MTSVFTSARASVPGWTGRRARRASSTGVLAVVLAAGLTLTGTGIASAAPVPLGSAESFAVLAGTGGVTRTGASTVTGDIGVNSDGTISGTGTIAHTGAQYANDTVSQAAQNSLVTTYDYLAQAGPATPIAAGEVGGKTFTAGVHNSGTFGIGLTGSVILDGGGDANAVFIFQSPSALTTASGSSVTLTNGAQACNVFWQVTSSATLGTTTSFKGTIVALTSITLATGATIEGRALARNGGVTLDENTITRPVCAAPPAGGPSTPGTGVGTGPSAAPGGGTPTGADSGQIRRVPVGSVDTGDGSLPAASRASSCGGVPSA